jgi:hypothetical protein
MSVGGRARAREQVLKRAAFVAAGLAVLALLFLLSSHWILGGVFAVGAAVAVWVFAQARKVR